MSTNALLPGQAVVVGAVVALVYLVALAAGLAAYIVATIVAWWRDRRDALRLLEDLDKHLAHDPEVRAAFARLDAAVRGEQRGEAS